MCAYLTALWDVGESSAPRALWELVAFHKGDDTLPCEESPSLLEYCTWASLMLSFSTLSGCGLMSA